MMWKRREWIDRNGNAWCSEWTLDEDTLSEPLNAESVWVRTYDTEGPDVPPPGNVSIGDNGEG